VRVGDERRRVAPEEDDERHAFLDHRRDLGAHLALPLLRGLRMVERGEDPVDAERSAGQRASPFDPPSDLVRRRGSDADDAAAARVRDRRRELGRRRVGEAHGEDRHVDPEPVAERRPQRHLVAIVARCRGISICENRS
jgi:hypothetical protein